MTSIITTTITMNKIDKILLPIKKKMAEEKDERELGRATRNGKVFQFAAGGHSATRHCQEKLNKDYRVTNEASRTTTARFKQTEKILEIFSAS